MEKIFRRFKEASKATDWGTELSPDEHLSIDQIRLGTELRIADATELMAQNHQQLTEERDRYKRWYEEEKRTTEKLARRIAGKQGYITRLKRK